MSIGAKQARLTEDRGWPASSPASARRGHWQDENVAVALIDQFSEAVPMAERSTYAAFGFNAPAARPPQAILLAVPPRSDRRSTRRDLLDILEETRELLRARAARPEDVVQYPAPPTCGSMARARFACASTPALNTGGEQP